VKPATRRTTVAFSILGVAAAALVMDKTILAPGGASAATPETSAEGQAPTATENLRVVTGSPTPGAQPAPAAKGKVASRLSIALDSPKWTPDQVIGSLRPTPDWVGGDDPKTGSATAPGADFKSRHTLRAVMNGRADGNGVAMIDGKAVKIGDALDGYTLVQVGARSAVFESGSLRVVLNLPGTQPDR
jgi:hypothetical protein